MERNSGNNRGAGGELLMAPFRKAGKVQALAISSGKLKAGTYMIKMQGDKIQTQKLVMNCFYEQISVILFQKR